MPYFNIKTQTWSDVQPLPSKDLLQLAKEISEKYNCTVQCDGIENFFINKQLSAAEQADIASGVK